MFNLKILSSWLRSASKAVYTSKIKVMFYFNLGYGEVSGIISMVKDIAIILGFAVLVFHFKLSVLSTIIICFTAFAAFILTGLVLKATGMSDFSNRMNNSVNPELKLINKIADKLDVER